MKKVQILVLGLFLANSLFAQDVSLSGTTSVFASFSHDNDSFTGIKDPELTSMIALEDVSLRFSPFKDMSAWLDASCFGSVMRYQNDDKTVTVPFSIAINQVYITYDAGYNHFSFGKKVFNYGCSSNYPLVNLINPRRDDKVRLVSEGNGAFSDVIAPVDWTSFSATVFFNSEDTVGSLDDISYVLTTDFFYKNYTLSVYSYFLKPIDSGAIRDFFTDYDAFIASANSGNTQMEFPVGFSGSAQFGFFTLYSEILFQQSPLKYSIVKDSGGNKKMERVEKGSFWDMMAGCRFASSKLSAELEYCRAKTGYDADEIGDLFGYLQTSSADIGKCYCSTRIFYRNNASLSIGYKPVPELTISVSDKVSFPEFGCDMGYLGNQVSFGVDYVVGQALEFSLSGTYGFGGNKSEFVFFNQHDLVVIFGTKLFY